MYHVIPFMMVLLLVSLWLLWAHHEDAVRRR